MSDVARAFDERHHLSASLQSLGISAEADLIERLWGFTSLLLKWNRTYNLTGARDETTLVREHLLDSLAAVPILEKRLGSESARKGLLVDVGAGAGFPGIVIGSVHPDWPLALVEPNGKKAAFLRQATAALSLRHVHPIPARLEATEASLKALMPSPDAPRHFTCRAVATLSELITLIRPLARPDSRLYALKSRHLSEEIGEIPDVSIHSLSVPGLDIERTVVELPLFPAEPPPATAGTQPSR